MIAYVTTIKDYDVKGKLYYRVRHSNNKLSLEIHPEFKIVSITVKKVPKFENNYIWFNK